MIESLLSSYKMTIDAVFRIRIGFNAERIEHFMSMRIRIQIQGFDDQKLEKN
jgi:hypothetical protein